MSYKFEDLDFKKPLYAIVEFQFNGKTYAVGELFPWNRLAVGKHLVARMWNARKLRHTLQGALAGVEVPEVPTGIPATLENIGMGWYNITVEGLGAVNPTKLKGKAAALAWAAENNYLTGDNSSV